METGKSYDEEEEEWSSSVAAIENGDLVTTFICIHAHFIDYEFR